MQSIEIETHPVRGATTPGTTTPGTRPQPLVHLTPGTSARVHATDLPGDEIALLRALGLSERCVLRLAKAGDPWIVQVRATRIGLSEAVARRILVVPEIGTDR